MPYSDSRFDTKVKKLIAQDIKKGCTRFLDLGAGAGKYGKLIKSLLPQAYVEAVEIEKKYIRDFSLATIYDKVYQLDIIKFCEKRPNYTTDVVAIGDCLEHLWKSQGIDLLNFLIYRCKEILIIYPSKYIQYSWQSHDSEAHRSVWTQNDFKDFQAKFYQNEWMNLTQLTGYLADTESVFPETKN